MTAGVTRRRCLGNCCRAIKCRLKLSNISLIIGIGRSIIKTPRTVIIAPRIMPHRDLGTVSPQPIVVIVVNASHEPSIIDLISDVAGLLKRST